MARVPRLIQTDAGMAGPKLGKWKKEMRGVCQAGAGRRRHMAGLDGRGSIRLAGQQGQG